MQLLVLNINFIYLISGRVHFLFSFKTIYNMKSLYAQAVFILISVIFANITICMTQSLDETSATKSLFKRQVKSNTRGPTSSANRGQGQQTNTPAASSGQRQRQNSDMSLRTVNDGANKKQTLPSSPTGKQTNQLKPSVATSRSISDVSAVAVDNKTSSIPKAQRPQSNIPDGGHRPPNQQQSGNSTSPRTSITNPQARPTVQRQGDNISTQAFQDGVNERRAKDISDNISTQSFQDGVNEKIAKDITKPQTGFQKVQNSFSNPSNPRMGTVANPVARPSLQQQDKNNISTQAFQDGVNEMRATDIAKRPTFFQKLKNTFVKPSNLQMGTGARPSVNGNLSSIQSSTAPIRAQSAIARPVSPSIAGHPGLAPAPEAFKLGVDVPRVTRFK
jgi:hypothetical protein